MTGADPRREAEAAPIPVDEGLFDDDADSSIGDVDGSNSSTSSLTDSIWDYRKIHGRSFQNSRTTEYWAPIDDQQNEGLDIAHHFLTLLLEDELFLAPIGDDPQKILDVGTGTGIWAIDIADQFPSAEVIGTDISPIQPPWVPPNCIFQIDDAQLPWTWPPDYFDFVHIRNLHGGISDWAALYKQCFTHTRPGGWFEDLEFDIRTLSDKVGPDHVYHQWNDLFQEAGERMGRTFKTASRMKHLITEAGFTNVVETKWKVPIGGWSSDPRLKQIGLYTLTFLDQSLEGFALFMLKEIMGWEYAEILVLVAKMRQALKDWRLYLPYYEVTLVYGQKP